jgi:PPOX class probable F420-dependent enzyme
VFSLDTSTDFGSRTQARMREELVAWLTTVSPRTVPQPTPVWFLWTGRNFLVASQPHTTKLRNIAEHPAVSLHFNSDRWGGDVQKFTGTAGADAGPLAGVALSAYDEKYAEHIAGLSMTPEQFHADYSVVVRITPSRLSGF